MGYIKQGNTIVAWGPVGKRVNFKEFPSGKAVTNFSIQYEFKRDEDGNKQRKYLDVDAWGDLAYYTSGLESGDTVLLAGNLIRDVYRSEKTGEDVLKLNAAICLVQPVIGGEDEYESAEPDRERKPKKAARGKDNGLQEPQFENYEDPGIPDLPEGWGDGELPDFLQ